MSAGALERLASAVALIEQHRARLLTLRATADDLATCDVVVVDGEHAVLSALQEELAGVHPALTELVRRPDDDAALQRFEAVARSGAWSVLDTVDDLLVEKQKIAELARRQVQARLAGWADLSTRVAKLTKEIQDRHLYVAEPRELAATRSRMDALLRQANNGYKDDQLVDAWRALVELEMAQPVPPAEVPDRLAELIGRAQAARAVSGRLQLTALRGPLDRDRYEYTFMLLTPTGDRHIGINVQDSSTIVRGDRQYFLEQAEAAGLVNYRALRDGRPPAALSSPSPHEVTSSNLRTMGQVLYRLLIPDRMKEELARHATTPITIITNDLEIPWELMVTDGFLALERPIARMPVGRARARHTPAAEVRRRRRRVALIASTGRADELEGAVREVRAIARSLRSTWADDVTVDTFGAGDDQDPTGARFRTVLVSSDYDIIHYAGHAVFDRVHPDQSGLVLADGEICFAQKIQRLLEGSPLVFLNACESARLRGADAALAAGGYQDDPDDGLASAFVYGGALACIGTMWPVLDAEAADFAIAFYNAVLEGHLLGEAMRLARVQAAEASPDDPNWASFVLYGDPTFSLDTPLDAPGRVDPDATPP